MEEENKRQAAEKREIEKRLKEKLAKQKEDEEEKISAINQKSKGKDDRATEKENMYNKAPSYYQPNIVPQNPLSPDNLQLYNEFIAKLVNPFTPLAELRAMFMLPVPKQIG